MEMMIIVMMKGMSCEMGSSIGEFQAIARSHRIYKSGPQKHLTPGRHQGQRKVRDCSHLFLLKDILIFSKSPHEHIIQVWQVFQTKCKSHSTKVFFFTVQGGFIGSKGTQSSVISVHPLLGLALPREACCLSSHLIRTSTHVPRTHYNCFP